MSIWIFHELCNTGFDLTKIVGNQALPSAQDVVFGFKI